jgi:hypothetical protein
MNYVFHGNIHLFQCQDTFQDQDEAAASASEVNGKNPTRRPTLIWQRGGRKHGHASAPISLVGMVTLLPSIGERKDCQIAPFGYYMLNSVEESV